MRNLFAIVVLPIILLSAVFLSMYPLIPQSKTFTETTSEVGTKSAVPYEYVNLLRATVVFIDCRQYYSLDYDRWVTTCFTFPLVATTFIITSTFTSPAVTYTSQYYVTSNQTERFSLYAKLPTLLQIAVILALVILTVLLIAALWSAAEKKEVKVAERRNENVLGSSDGGPDRGTGGNWPDSHRNK